MEFSILPKTPLYSALSKLGKEIYQPDGIFYWSGRAKNEAEFNATIGTAVGPETDILPNGRAKNLTYYLPAIKKYINLDPEKLTEYAPINGVLELRKLWSDWIRFKGEYSFNQSSVPIDITGKYSLPVITCGITHAIYIAAKLFLDPGEKIIMPNKSWENYESIFTLNEGLVVQTFQFFKNKQFNSEALSVSLRDVAQEQERVVVILNFPNNPTGYTPTPEEVKKIVDTFVEFCESTQRPVVVIIDDAYENFVYAGGRQGRSIFYDLVDKHPYIIPVKLDGSSKEMLMYGARIAAITIGFSPLWCDEDEFPTLDKEWDNKLQAMIRTNISNCNHFSQEVLIDLMKLGFENIVNARSRIIKILQERYIATLKALDQINNPNITVDPSGGGFFIFLNIEGVDGIKLADHLLSVYKVGTIPIVNAKEGINGIRFAFCSVQAKFIEECIKRINLAIADLAEDNSVR